MNFNTCFHEICHLWVMVNYLGFESGRACVAYDTGDEGMLTVEGYNPVYNGYDDLEDGLAFIIAGVAGDKINSQFDDEDDAYELFESDYSYSQDYRWFKKLYEAAVNNHSLNVGASEWFDEKFIEVEEYLLAEDIEEMKAAAEELLAHGEYVLSQEA